MEFKAEGTEAREKIVGNGGASGRIYVPKSWIGESVIVILKKDD